MHGTLSQLPLPRHSSILAFDLGKFNSVLCRFDPATAADWRIPPLAPASGRVARPKAGANGGIREDKRDDCGEDKRDDSGRR
jgi:hypothetical protein